MPRGPKGEKRPADAIGNAIMIAKIATGEIEDITTEDGKNAAAVALGRMGGKARAAGMTAKKRKEIAKKAAKARWAANNCCAASFQTESGSIFALFSVVDGFLSVAESAQEPDRYGDESSANP